MNWPTVDLSQWCEEKEDKKGEEDAVGIVALNEMEEGEEGEEGQEIWGSQMGIFSIADSALVGIISH